MKSLGGATSRDSFLKAYKPLETKWLLPMNGLINPTKSTIQNFTRNMLFTVSFAAVTLSRPNTWTRLTYWKVDWPQNKPISNWNCQSHPLLELRTINTCNSYGSKNKWAHSKIFFGGITIKICANFRNNAKKDCFLPWQRYRYVKAWLYFTKHGQHLLTQIYSKFYPFTKGDKDLLEKIRDVVGGQSIIFTRKAVVDETFIRKSANLCKTILGIDASHLYPYSMCQPMPTGLYTRWDYGSETSRITSRQNKTRSFGNMVKSYFQRKRPERENESLFTTGRQKKIDCFSGDGFCSHCNTLFEALGCSYHFCPCQELRPSLTEEDIQRGSKKREIDALWRRHIQAKGFKVIEMWECEW